MDRQTVGSFLWIVVTVIIMLCLIAIASPFGVFIKENVQKFTGDYIEQNGQSNEVIEIPTVTITIQYQYQNGATAAVSNQQILKQYEQYNVPSPEITGYQPNMTIVSGVAVDDATITVQYSLAEYKITYVTNEGVWKSGYNAPATYKYTNTTSLPTASQISRENYNFVGWYENENFEGSAVSTIPADAHEDKIFYAKWEAKQYQIVYILNDTPAGMEESSSGHYYRTAEYKTGFNAAWDEEVLDGSGNLDNKYRYYNYGEQKKFPVSVSKFGYTFLGWSTTKDGTEYRTQVTETDEGIITLYAQWKRNTYTITYHMEFRRPDVLVPYFEDVSPDAEMAEYAFLNASSYTYTYIDGDGNTKTGKGLPTTYTYGDHNITLPTEVFCTGYDGSYLMATWYNKKVESISISGGNVIYSPNPESTLIRKQSIGTPTNGFNEETVSGAPYDHTNLDFYIKPIPNTYRIVFDANNPTDAEFMSGYMSPQTLTYDQATQLSKNQFACKGYKFLGWNTRPNASGKFFSDAMQVINLTASSNDTVTLYAIWQPVEAGVYITVETYYEDASNTGGFTLGDTFHIPCTADTNVHISPYINQYETEGFTFYNITEGRTTGSNMPSPYFTSAHYWQTRALPDSSRVVKIYYTRMGSNLSGIPLTATLIVLNPTLVDSASVYSPAFGARALASNSDTITINAIYGETIEFNATHVPSAVLREWKDRDGLLHSSNAMQYNVTMPDRDIVILLDSEQNMDIVIYFTSEPSADIVSLPGEIAQPAYWRESSKNLNLPYVLEQPFGTLPTVSKNCYIFLGWYTTETCSCPGMSNYIGEENCVDAVYRGYYIDKDTDELCYIGGNSSYTNEYHSSCSCVRVTESTVFTQAMNGTTLYARWIRDPNPYAHAFVTVSSTSPTCTQPGETIERCYYGCGVKRIATAAELGHLYNIATADIILSERCYRPATYGVRCTRSPANGGCGSSEYVITFTNNEYANHITDGLSNGMCCQVHIAEFPNGAKWSDSCWAEDTAHTWGLASCIICGADGQCMANPQRTVWCGVHHYNETPVNGISSLPVFHCGRYGEVDTGNGSQAASNHRVFAIDWESEVSFNVVNGVETVNVSYDTWMTGKNYIGSYPGSNIAIAKITGSPYYTGGRTMPTACSWDPYANWRCSCGGILLWNNDIGKLDCISCSKTFAMAEYRSPRCFYCTKLLTWNSSIKKFACTCRGFNALTNTPTDVHTFDATDFYTGPMCSCGGAFTWDRINNLFGCNSCHSSYSVFDVYEIKEYCKNSHRSSYIGDSYITWTDEGAGAYNSWNCPCH